MKQVRKTPKKAQLIIGERRATFKLTAVSDLTDEYSERLFGRRTRKKQEHDHGIDVFHTVLKYTGDLDLALFALCHQFHYKGLLLQSHLAYLLNPYLFEDYELLRHADTNPDKTVRMEIYSALMQRRPELFLVRAIDLADSAKFGREELENIFRKVEPDLPLKEGMGSLAKAITEMYFHITERMGIPELSMALAELRMSLTNSRIFERCKALLEDNHEKLDEIKTLVHGILPTMGGSVISVKTRIKKVGSLSGKLIDKMKEMGKKADEKSVYEYYLKNESARQRLKNEILDLVGAEVTVEPAFMKYTIDQIEDDLKRRGFRDIRVERKSKEKENGSNFEVYYINAKVPKKIGDFNIEIQVQTEEMASIRSMGEFFHAGYKGFVLGSDALKNIDALARAIKEGNPTPTEEFTRCLVPIIEALELGNGETQRIEMKLENGSSFNEHTIAFEITGKQPRRALVVPFPEEVTILDVVANTTGLEGIKTVGELVFLSGTSNRMYFVGENAVPGMAHNNLDVGNSGFKISTAGTGEYIPVKVLKRILGKATPHTLSGRTQLNILLKRY